MSEGQQETPVDEQNHEAQEQDVPQPEQEGAAVEEKTQESRGGDRRRRGRADHSRPDILGELTRLVELTTKYPEIGPVVAELAEKTGFRQISERLMKLGLESGQEGVEYHFIAARLARREGRSEEVLELVIDALRRQELPAEVEEGQEAPKGSSELLHLVRLGFATLLFDLGGPDAAPRFTETLSDVLPTLREHYKGDAFYLTLLAQAVWFEDKERSEEAWEEALACNDTETTWNARGTWAKEADKDMDKAESIYRRGLDALPHSALLRHNLAQALMEKALVEGLEVAAARKLLSEADRHLRRALREVHRARNKRHIHASLERLQVQRSQLARPDGEEAPAPAPKAPRPKPPEVGDVVRGRVRSLATYGAFVDLEQGGSGLLHKSEMAHRHVHDPAQEVEEGQELEVKVIEVRPRENGRGMRIGLSLKALTPAPEGQEAGAGDAPDRRRPPRDNRRGGRGRGGNSRGGNNRGGNSRGGNNRGGNDRGERRPPRNNHNEQRSGGSGANRNESKNDGRMGSLGEMLLAKLRERDEKK